MCFIKNIKKKIKKNKISKVKLTLRKKWSYPFRISSVNVTKFGRIYWRNPYWKTSFFVQRDVVVRGKNTTSKTKPRYLKLIKQQERYSWCVYVLKHNNWGILKCLEDNKQHNTNVFRRLKYNNQDVPEVFKVYKTTRKVMCLEVKMHQARNDLHI